MKHALAMAACLVTAACGAHAPLPAVVSASPRESSVGGVRVITAHRATEGHVAAGLFLRTRGGDAALRATAALIIEARGRGAWRVRATPDGIALRTTADAERTPAALASLARALDVREPTEGEVGAALERVRRRRAARASDDTATGVRLAIEALGGDTFDAFGTADEQAAVTSSRVAAWLANTLGQERALVVVVGDLDDAELHAAIGESFRDAPHVAANDDAAPRWEHGAARVASGDHPIAAAATAAASLDEGARIADWIERLLPRSHATSFPLRGRAVVSATLEGDESALRALAAAITHARMLDDERTTPTARNAEDELLALGDAWLAQVIDTGASDIGLALVRVTQDDHAETTDAALDALVTAPVTPTAIDAARAEATLTNGMHVRVARVEGDAVAIALSWAGGAALDPAREHGRTALLAAVLSRSCEPDADASWVDDATFGIVIRGERATLERSALRAIDCARGATTEVAHTEGIRAAAIADIDFGHRVRAWAAAALAPGAPGLVAPEGSATGLAAAGQLEDAMLSALDPRRATLTIVGDEAPERLLAIADALGSSLRPGTDALRADARTIAEGPSQTFVTDAQLDVPIAVVALRTDVGASDVGARFIAHALAEQLGARGLAVRAFFGNASGASSFAIVAVTGADDRLDALPTIAREAIGALVIGDALATDDERAARDRALSLAAPDSLARSLATLTHPSPAADVARSLLHAQVHLVLARPAAAPFRRTR